MKILLYLRLLKLYASNLSMLDLYYKLYYQLDGEEDTFKKISLSHRIAIREKMKLQFIMQLEKIEADCENSFPACSLVHTFKNVVEITKKLKIGIDNKNWENCYERELHNLNSYYNTLYSSPMPKEITNLLLNQKTNIEEYILKEM